MPLGEIGGTCGSAGRQPGARRLGATSTARARCRRNAALAFVDDRRADRRLRARRTSTPPSRLVVEGDRIVEADAPGLARAARGPDAARGRRRARRDARRRRARERDRAASSAAAPAPGRVAVAMSGGVDSAVALLRARPGRGRRHAAPLARPGRPERRARLLLARRRHRRARDLPRARAAARHPRPARGVPRRGRPAVRRGLRGRASRRTRACAATGRSASTSSSRSPRRAGADVLWTGPLRTHRRSATAGAWSPAATDAGEGPVVHARDRRPGAARPRRVPARQSRRRRQTRAEAAAAGLAVAERAGEPGGVLPRRRRLPRRSSRGRASRRARPDRRRGGRELGRHDGHLALHARPAARDRRRRRPSRSTRSERTRATNTLVVGPRAAARRATRRRRGRALRPRRAGRGEAPLPLVARRRGRRAAPRAASRSSSTSRPTPSHPARSPCSTTATPSSERASSSPRLTRVGSRAMTARLHRRRRRLLGARDLPRLARRRLAPHARSGSARRSSGSRRSSAGTERDLLPVIVKTGGTVDRVNYQLDKARHRHRQRRLDGGQRRHRRARRVDGDRDARGEGLGARGGDLARLLVPQVDAEPVGGDGRRQGRRAPARAGPRGGPPRRRPDAAVDRAADADSDADARAEARPVAEASSDAEARPGAGPARRASLADLEAPRRAAHGLLGDRDPTEPPLRSPACARPPSSARASSPSSSRRGTCAAPSASADPAGRTTRRRSSSAPGCSR